jgi:hypothetical protein
MHRPGANDAVHAVTSTCIAAAWLLIASSVSGEAQILRLWGDLRPGPSSVGYRVVRTFDEGRSFEPRAVTAEPSPFAPDRRLMTARIWYPAAQSTARMAMRRYLDLRDNDRPITEEARERRHGYVVAVTPSLGSQTVAMEPVGPTSAEVKTRDLEFVTQWLRAVPFTDMNRVAAVGFSLGGWSALMLGMRSGDIDAVVAVQSPKSRGGGSRDAVLQAIRVYPAAAESAPG